VQAYTAASARLGAQLRDTLRGLGADTGPRDRLVVVSSLHGLSLLEPEGFNDEAVDPFDHNVLLDRTTHVPMVFTGSAAPEGFAELHQVVELADLLPTIAPLAGATPPAGLHGEDLLAVEGSGDPQAWAYAELGDMLMVRRGDHMLLFRTFLHDRSSLDPELDALLAESTPGQEPFWTFHDVLLDPGQQRDLVPHRPPELSQLRGLMLAVRQGPGAVPPEFLDPEKVWELRMTRIQSYW
jgi:arylsulfatase A-like enzyme